MPPNTCDQTVCSQSRQAFRNACVGSPSAFSALLIGQTLAARAPALYGDAFASTVWGCLECMADLPAPYPGSLKHWHPSCPSRVGPAVSARCWLTGRKPRQSSVPDAAHGLFVTLAVIAWQGTRAVGHNACLWAQSAAARGCKLYPGLLRG